MRIYLRTILLVAICQPFTINAFAQKTLWNELNAKVIILYQQGRYSDAANVAKEALKVAKRTFGPDHPDVATSLNNLALLYRSQGKYDEAEPLYKRALAIWEDAFGPDHPNVLTVLENMSDLYKNIGKEDEAKRLEERVKIIRSSQ
ncbi:MAG: tetratricopeptide repeat protein [Deltaproteobacteria bacterium]|nr:tetratricopeptide repeat protein [Deltaproteobacteria bacterium]